MNPIAALLRIGARRRDLLRRGPGPLLLRGSHRRHVLLIQLRGNRLKRERVAPAARPEIRSRAAATQRHRHATIISRRST